jgi:hypothetical protein
LAEFGVFVITIDGCDRHIRIALEYKIKKSKLWSKMHTIGRRSSAEHNSPTRVVSEAPRPNRGIDSDRSGIERWGGTEFCVVLNELNIAI